MIIYIHTCISGRILHLYVRRAILNQKHILFPCDNKYKTYPPIIQLCYRQ